WFGLDALPVGAPPRLATWAARGRGLAAEADALRPVHGELLPMSRGDLRWQITVPPDGGLPLDGLAPTLLEWSGNDHPSRRLPDQGCRLRRLTAHTPEPAALRACLAALGLADALAIEPLPPGAAPWVGAEIDTPAGLRRLPVTGG
ncbi:MAG: VOC family protein, partial [Burkholderiaceae bacterium]